MTFFSNQSLGIVLGNKIEDRADSGPESLTKFRKVGWLVFGLAPGLLLAGNDVVWRVCAVSNVMHLTMRDRETCCVASAHALMSSSDKAAMSPAEAAAQLF